MSFLLNVMLVVVQFPFSPHFFLWKLASIFGFAACFVTQTFVTGKRKKIAPSFTACCSICRWQPVHLKRTVFLYFSLMYCCLFVSPWWGFRICLLTPPRCFYLVYLHSVTTHMGYNLRNASPVNAMIDCIVEVNRIVYFSFNLYRLVPWAGHLSFTELHCKMIQKRVN